MYCTVIQYYINVLHCITIALRLLCVYVYCATCLKFKVFEFGVKNFRILVSF
ncbi:hypothetical protein HMPREF3208_00814 [Gardnerella vaginalis]|uniref:Uncharacterized protein n=1 Tax=Gardnerella vaginalis TaxID=2702 RepID=A0A133NVR6_GARVA|nr:hypothetical protein HMPREF3208_00814 [Gardnerella vaginalis]